MTRPEGAPALRWPRHLTPGAVRASHSSARFDQSLAFYRDVLGLPLIVEFTASFGEDGVVFGLPAVRAHLEIVRAHATASAVDPMDQLVFYLPGPDAVAAASARLTQAGAPPDRTPQPYWAANGAVVHLDPDGRRIVFAPWVFGFEPSPTERVAGRSADAG
jgi:catechol 2,3-dioxygenase-like lactoylglutathione lyase family enzyme